MCEFLRVNVCCVCVRQKGSIAERLAGEWRGRQENEESRTATGENVFVEAADVLEGDPGLWGQGNRSRRGKHRDDIFAARNTGMDGTNIRQTSFLTGISRMMNSDTR